MKRKRYFEDGLWPFLEVQRFLSKAGVRVPTIYDYGHKKGLILQEDLGDQTLLHSSALFTVKQELEAYKKCVDILIKFQSFPIEKGVYSFEKLRFDSEKLSSEIDFTIHHFFHFLMGKNLSQKKQEIGRIRGHFQSICQTISEQEMVFTHRDFHSRNIMARGDELVIIDFQDARPWSCSIRFSFFTR